jgi:hypothetical protein
MHLKEEAASPLVALHFYDDVPKALQPLLQPGLCLNLFALNPYRFTPFG